VVDTFETPSFPWGGQENRTVFADLEARYGVKFIAGAGLASDEVVSKGVNNIGRMSLVDFNKRLTQSRMVVSWARDLFAYPLPLTSSSSSLQIGIGNPLLSPTPYDALCREWLSIGICVAEEEADFRIRSCACSRHSLYQSDQSVGQGRSR